MVTILGFREREKQRAREGEDDTRYRGKVYKMETIL